jgi:hypothetical protein
MSNSRLECSFPIFRKVNRETVKPSGEVAAPMGLTVSLICAIAFWLSFSSEKILVVSEQFE